MPCSSSASTSVVDVLLRRRHPDRREAEALVDRHVGAVFATAERELVLERDLEPARRALGEPRRHRFRNERGHCGAGSPSSVTWSTSSAPVRGAYGRTRNVSRSGTSRISPTGPIPSTGWSWSSPLIACIADRQADAAREPPFQAVPAARLRAHVPSLPHQRKRTRRRPSASTRPDDARCVTAPGRSNSSSQRASIDCSSSRARGTPGASRRPPSRRRASARARRARPRARRSRTRAARARSAAASARLRPRLRLRLRLRLGLGREPRRPELVAPADVLGPAAVVAADSRVLECERPLGDRVDERAVVRDEQDRPGKRFERGFERLARLEVEVVRRLVEHEEVRARGDDVREREPAPLAAREHRDRLLVLVPAGEEEAAEQRLRLRRAEGSSRAASTRAPCAARPARPPAARSSRRRRCGRAARGRRPPRACRAASRSASSSPSRSARRARRAPRARARTSPRAAARVRRSAARRPPPRRPFGRCAADR